MSFIELSEKKREFFKIDILGRINLSENFRSFKRNI